jgi:cation diffusion facilitator family transporter
VRAVSEEEHSTSHIVQSLAVNTAIAISKFVAAFFTRSGAMMAEAIHSLADCANQVLLLFGVRRAKQAPDASHPLGYGRELYFWSFMVAMLLFTGGGIFSIYEGVHKIASPEPIEHVGAGLAVLGIAFVLEGGSVFSNVREINKRRKGVPFFRYLRDSKDSDLIVVFGENAGDSLGLFCALVTTLLAYFTNDGLWDGVGSLAVGLVLVGIAVFLAGEVKSLLVGEAADESVSQAVEAAAAASPTIGGVLRLITVQQGPGEIMVAVKVRLEKRMTSDEVIASINEFERDIKRRCPEVRWSFVEPDDHA